ncbi:glycosyl transferase family 1 [Dulcicalothrix desertica PCC 7102]|uniref:Glycosyl transferase family 1 n=1 Tax=Dulcicalothrix desertica PCC 7102 TaxID=232991 RepID=A0A3S1C1J1_9CYAN|nr:hormogonium polysaccharide biosynthesis glycosyltransferase HpsO [Dulcicalothrix desertica]RUS94996.1 glycosyl transferase family 1 [Dulcicalothrix desertica PCC 7102]TWH51426.1 glycosyltransferase involved in cell wall biosynthesis [Dulcicalothrix desertica PCC 7102]
MKILVASHTYIVDLNCEKLRALSRLEEDTQVTVVVPKRWKPGGVQNKIIETQYQDEGNFRIVPVSNFSQNHQGLLTFGTDLVPLLKSFRPDIIQVEQGAKSLAYAEMITLNKLLALKAKNVFFTWWNLPYSLNKVASLLEKYNLDNTHGIISGNQDGASILRQRGYNGKIKVMPQLGIDENLFTPKLQPELSEKLNLKLGEFIIGFVGRFVPEKGIMTLLSALETIKHKEWKCLLLGRGELKDELLQKARAANLEDRIIIVESVPHHEVCNYINLMSTLVLPSETTYKFKTLTSVGWKEQFGHVIIEAMACQTPVIGSDSGEIPHVIGNAGMIFPEGNVNSLANCLTALIEDPELAHNLGQLGYAKAMSQYTNTALAKQQLDFYKEILTK